jgi:hypothetical protein
LHASPSQHRIMGSNRKSKTPNTSQQRKIFNVSSKDEDNNNNHHENSVAVNGIIQRGYYVDDEDGVDRSGRNLDFSKVLQDVEGSLVHTMTSGVVAISGLLSSSPSNNTGGSFRVTWKELVYLLLAIVILAGLSIFMGVAAGITISIHYFDTHTTPSFPRLEARERDLGPHQRVTTLDYSIASSNFLHPLREITSGNDNELDLTLGRVITMSESGQRSVLFVVEETPPLHQNEGNETHANELLSVCSNETAPVDSDGRDLLLDGQYKPYRHRGPPDSRFQLTTSKVHPTICSDGVTVGFDDWATLKAAVEEANALSAERFMKWNEYFASLDGSPKSSDWFHKLLEHAASQRDTCNNDNDLFQYYYDNYIVFTICPGTTLKARRGPIFINAENIQIECGDPEEYNYIRAAQQPTASASTRSLFSREIPTCTVDVGATHLAFGPHAKNVLVRGIVFQSAKTSSLAFHYDGAQASFEDCIWMDNAGVHGKYGAVADVNSTSNVNFYRCEIGSSLSRVANIGGSGPGGGLPMAGHGENPVNNLASGPFGNGMSPGFASFLSLRN